MKNINIKTDLYFVINNTIEKKLLVEQFTSGRIELTLSYISINNGLYCKHCIKLDLKFVTSKNLLKFETVNLLLHENDRHTLSILKDPNSRKER